MIYYLIDSSGENVARVEACNLVDGVKTFVREYRDFLGESRALSPVEVENVVSAMLSDGYRLTGIDTYIEMARKHHEREIAALGVEKWFHDKQTDGQPSVYEVLEAA